MRKRDESLSLDIQGIKQFPSLPHDSYTGPRGFALDLVAFLLYHVLTLLGNFAIALRHPRLIHSDQPVFLVPCGRRRCISMASGLRSTELHHSSTP